MKINNKQTGNEGAFYIDKGGYQLAEMTYTVRDGVMIIDHTEVDESLRGRNVGNELVARAVEFAREKNIKILPQCSFARSVFEKQKELSDVLT
jgi:uncharacterized protein